MKSHEPLVYVIDDDEAVRDSLSLLLVSVDLEHAVYVSADEFLRAYDPSRQACIVTDIRMPGTSGLDLQSFLAELGAEIPIIFITGHGDVPMAVKAMKAGALDFLQKPFRDQDLIDRIHKALEQDEARRAELREEQLIRERLETLTPREEEVMQLVVGGSANKVIAMDLGVSQRTVELHRARVMHKLCMRSVAELVQAVGKLAKSKPRGPAQA
ncbi:MAG TPA: response regulator [Gammaproteobacteria bacterium]|nr:response regulator [Gammaproteobacteria bacterium]